MHTFDTNSACVIAADLQSTFGSLDAALVRSANLLGTVVETAAASRLNATESQRLYQCVASGLSHVVASRSEIVDAMKRMTILKRRSNLETVDIGCDNPLRTIFTTSESRPAVHDTIS